jgi:hypothetical protein
MQTSLTVDIVYGGLDPAVNGYGRSRNEAARMDAYETRQERYG